MHRPFPSTVMTPEASQMLQLQQRRRLFLAWFVLRAEDAKVFEAQQPQQQQQRHM